MGSVRCLIGATLGPVTNTIVCDVSASTLRSKTIALSRAVYDALSLVQAAAGPYMLDSAHGNMNGYTALPAARFTVLWLLWAVLRLPEMDGMSTQVLDHLFDAGVPARRFVDQAARLDLGLELVVDGEAKSEMPSTESSAVMTP